ncbi:MAG: hypothetical protein IJ489_11200 [Clostridia bacterium]|nr:hypothetical protein [Clostridia bacterium]
MYTTMQKIWRGDLFPSSEEGAQQKKSLELCELIERHTKTLSQTLSKEEKETLEKLEDAFLEWISIDCEDAFIKGFSLGIKLSAEALTND